MAREGSGRNAVDPPEGWDDLPLDHMFLVDTVFLRNLITNGIGYAELGRRLGNRSLSERLRQIDGIRSKRARGDDLNRCARVLGLSPQSLLSNTDPAFQSAVVRPEALAAHRKGFGIVPLNSGSGLDIGDVDTAVTMLLRLDLHHEVAMATCRYQLESSAITRSVSDECHTRIQMALSLKEHQFRHDREVLRGMSVVIPSTLIATTVLFEFMRESRSIDLNIELAPHVSATPMSLQLTQGLAPEFVAMPLSVGASFMREFSDSHYSPICELPGGSHSLLARADLDTRVVEGDLVGLGELTPRLYYQELTKRGAIATPRTRVDYLDINKGMPVPRALDAMSHGAFVIAYFPLDVLIKKIAGAIDMSPGSRELNWAPCILFARRDVARVREVVCCMTRSIDDARRALQSNDELRRLYWDRLWVSQPAYRRTIIKGLRDCGALNNIVEEK